MIYLSAAYMAAVLRLMSEAEGAGLVNPGDMDVMGVVEEEEEEGPVPYQRPAAQDYDDTGRSMNLGNSQAASWALLER